MNLTVAILTHNNEKFLINCLKSVSFAGQILILDKNSNDSTLDIAKKFNTKIIKFTGKHFDDWRNLALSNCQTDWLLYIDPDERIPKNLQKEILEVISHHSKKIQKLLPSAYCFPRKNFWWGKKFKNCGAWPDYVTRLFQTKKLKKWQGIIHESPVFEGNLATLSSPLIHLTHTDLITGLKKSINWTKMEAQLFVKSNHPSIKPYHLIKVTLSEFFRRFLFQKGYKEGIEGLIESMVQAYNRFLVYVQIWQFQQKPSIFDKYKELEKKL